MTPLVITEINQTSNQPIKIAQVSNSTQIRSDQSSLGLNSSAVENELKIRTFRMMTAFWLTEQLGFQIVSGQYDVVSVSYVY